MAKSLEEIEKEWANLQEQSQTEEKDQEVKRCERGKHQGKGRKEKEKAASGQAGKREKRSAGAIVADVLFYMLLAGIVAVAWFFSHNGAQNRYLFDRQYYEVLTSSMQSVYPKGSLVVVKKTKARKLEVGNDITYYKNKSTTITHRIIKIIKDYDGKGSIGFVTQGVENALPDEEIVDEKNVVGKVIAHIPRAGQWLSWTQKNMWTALAALAGVVMSWFFLKKFVSAMVTLVKTWKEDEEDSGDTGRG